MSVSSPRILTDFPTYCEKALMVKHRYGGRVHAMHLNPMQQIIEATALAMRQAGNPPRIAILKPRKLGVSTGIGARFLFDTATRRYQQGLVIAHRGTAVKKIFSIYERFYSNLPIINGINMKPKRVGARGSELYFPDLDSGLYVESASGDIRAGEAQRVHLSELGSVDDPEEVLAAVMPYVPKTLDSSVIIETSSPGKDHWFYGFWTDNKESDKYGWTCLFRPWMIEPTFAMSPGLPEEEWTDAEQSYHEEYGLTAEQLMWRRRTINQDFAGNEKRFRIEYPMSEEECWTLLGKSLWEWEDITACYQKCNPGFVGELTTHGCVESREGPLSIWEEPQPGCTYVIGADPAGGLDGGDNSAAIVWKVRRDARHWPIQVAEYAGTANPIMFAGVLKTLGLYYNKALLSVELTGIGRACQNTLMTTYHYPLLHRWVPWDRYGSKSQAYGWETGHKSKAVMMGLMDWLIRTHRLTFRSSELVRETMGMRQRGNQSEGEIVQYSGMGQFDDRFMAASIGIVSWFQHIFSGSSLMDLQQVLARTYGSDPEPDVEHPVATSGSPLGSMMGEMAMEPKSYVPKRHVKEEAQW